MKPFFEQHPVRGYFGDPRIGPSHTGEIVRTFHFGVDVAAPDGTPVFATITGTVASIPGHPDAIAVRGAGGVQFEYWHVVPAVRPGTSAVAYKTMIGRIEEPWAHVHFAERRNGVYVNPLRLGAMGPYADRSQPTIRQVRFEQAGVPLRARSTHGTFDIVVGAFDMPAMPVPFPEWTDLPVTPALIRWRVVTGDGRAISAWRTAYDARSSLPFASYHGVYAVGTRQNRPYRPGKYRFYLERGWSSASLPDGRYAVQVVADDAHGNSVEHEQPFTVSNRS